MTGHLTSILELWRLSLLTGHLPVQGLFRLGHRPEDYSTSNCNFRYSLGRCQPGVALLFSYFQFVGFRRVQ